MQLKEVIEQTGLTKKAIRYYEECGFIEPKRKENGYKNYEDNDIALLMKIKQLRLLEFSVQEIREYLNGDAQKVAEKKLADNQESIKKIKEANKQIKRLLDGELDIDFNSLTAKRKKQIAITRNNFIFGVVNVIVLIILCAISIGKDYSINMLYTYVMGGAVIFIQNKRREQQRKEGSVLYKRDIFDYIFTLIGNGCSYGCALTIVNSCLKSVGTIDWFNTWSNITLIISMVVLIILLTLLSFVDSFPNDVEFKSLSKAEE